MLTLSPAQAILGNQIVVGFLPTRTLANPDLKWETTEATNAGLDVGLFRNRITITADYYAKRTKDLLATVPLQTSSGFLNTVMNIGEIQNKGIELAVNGNVLNTNLKWDVSANPLKAIWTDRVDIVSKQFFINKKKIARSGYGCRYCPPNNWHLNENSEMCLAGN